MRRLRFTLFDLLVTTLGVGVGLAYGRLPGVRWVDALLIACMTWIVVGMVEQMRSAYRARQSLGSAEAPLRHGAALAMARPVAVIAMMSVAIGFELVRDYREDTETWPFDAFTPSLISLAIICAYLAPGRRPAHPSTRKTGAAHRVLHLLGLVLGGGWLVYVLVSAQTISGLVHIAIRGVEMAQPTRWLGKPLHPYDPQVKLTHEFFTGAVVTAFFALIAGISTIFLSACWDQRRVRWLLVATAAGSIALAACGAHWYWTVGYPRVSPFLAAQTLVQPWHVIAAGLSVLAGGCFLFVMRYVPEPNRPDDPSMPQAYHMSTLVMSAVLLAMIMGGTPQWWWAPSMGAVGLLSPFDGLASWWNSGARLLGLPQALLQIAYAPVSYWLDEPKMLLRLAAVLVVAGQLRRWRRGLLDRETIVRVRARKLVLVSLLALGTLLVAIPAGAWLGFAIVTTTFGGL